MTWPDDADGDVLRRMAKSGFDFTRPWLIDFNVDFDRWPPPSEALVRLACEFPSAKIFEPSEGSDGYVQFQLRALVSYALISQIQAEVSGWLAPYGGVCESWGVMH